MNDEMAVRIKTGEMYPLVNMANMIFTLSDFFTNTQKNFFRLFSDGDGMMHMVINNMDVKVKFNFPIPNGVEYDRMFSIAEMSKIVSNLINYSEFGINQDYVNYKDGHFKIYNFDNISPEDKKEYFSIDEKIAEQDALKFSINEDFVNEINRIFEFLSLKSDGYNFFFSDSGEIYFGFKTIFVAKRCFEQILSTDIFTLKVLYTLLSKYKEQDFYRVIDGKRFYIVSDQMYFEGYLIDQEQKNVELAKMIFDVESYDKVESFDLTREFYYFLDTVVSFDDESSLVFDSGVVTVNSRIIPEAVFNLKDMEVEDSFIMMASDIHKVMKFLLKKKKDLDVLDFKLVHNNMGRFLYYTNGDDTRIIMMILS